MASKKEIMELMKSVPHAKPGDGVDDWLDEEEFKAFVGEPDSPPEEESKKSVRKRKH